MRFQVAIETYNPPLKIAINLPDNGIYMVPRIAVDIQINFQSPEQSHTTTSASTRNNKSICKTNPVFNFLHPLNFQLCLHEEDNLGHLVLHHIVQRSD